MSDHEKPVVSRPHDHYDSRLAASSNRVTEPPLDFMGWLRWFWRQLTSMRTALLLLLLLAVAAIPGSLVPQRTADPNGVTQYFTDNPDLASALDKIQAFDVYSSVWFSAIYLLLFISLIGCVIPRTRHHLRALRAKPPKTPARLGRLAGFTTRDAPAGTDAAAAIDSARSLLRFGGYRVALFESGSEVSISAERGFLRESGNLLFHLALIGILIVGGFGSGFGFSGQRVLVEGQTFVNTLLAYDSFKPGRFFDEERLDPYTLALDSFDVEYETLNLKAYGQPVDYTAGVTVALQGQAARSDAVKVNAPLRVAGTDVFLLGNGYAPTITVRDPKGNIVFTDSVPFLPQDANLTSLGVVKVPDGLAQQLGLTGFFYPTQAEAQSGAYFSSFPDLEYPLLTLNVYAGELGLDAGVPASVYALNTDKMTQLTGGDTGTTSLNFKPGQTQDLPNGLGTVTFEDANPAAMAGDFSGSVLRFASFDINNDPAQGWVLLFSVLALLGLLTSLFVPRRRIWVKAIRRADGSVGLEYAGLARGDDPTLETAVSTLARRHSAVLAPIPSSALPSEPI